MSKIGLSLAVSVLVLQQNQDQCYPSTSTIKIKYARVNPKLLLTMLLSMYFLNNFLYKLYFNLLTVDVDVEM